MQFRRRRSRAWIWILTGVVALVLVGGILYNQGRPSVNEVFPSEGALAIPGPAPLRITFDRPMNAEAVTESLQTIPAREGNFFWEGNTMTFRPEQPWPAGQVISVTMDTGARSSLSVALDSPFRWSFTTAPTLLAYLWPSGSAANIYILDPGNGDIVQLSESAYGVLDFSVAPDSLAIFYSMQNTSGGADLWRMDLISRESERILDCEGDLCTNIRASSANELAFENTSINQVFFLTLENDNSSLMGSGIRPLWSSRGELAFYDPGEPGFIFRNLSSGQATLFSNETGEPGSWGPLGELFVAPEILAAVGSGLSTSHLILFELLTGSAVDLTQLANALNSVGTRVEDTSPSFAADGGWIAFARKFLDSERWTPGRQLWIMHPDGSDSRPISADPNFNHSAFTWHPTDPQLAYLRSDQTDTTRPTEIWLTLIDGSGPVRLVIGGYQPTWIP